MKTKNTSKKKVKPSALNIIKKSMAASKNISPFSSVARFAGQRKAMRNEIHDIHRKTSP